MKPLIDFFLNKDHARKVETELYPDPISSRSVEDLPIRSRGLIANTISTCTGCRDCAQVCPTGCIDIETQEQPKSFRLWVSKFDVRISECIFCGLCVDACEPESLTQTKHIQNASAGAEGQVLSFGKGRLDI